MPEAVEILVAKVAAHLEVVSEVTDRHLSQLDRDIGKIDQRTSSLHARLDDEIKESRRWWHDEISALRRDMEHARDEFKDGITEYKLWRARLIGYATGLGSLSALITAVVTGYIMRAVG